MVRSCSECGEPLVGGRPDQKTCSASCRSKRSRRLKRQRSNTEPYPPELGKVADVVTGDARDLAHEVIREELRPIVRESLTEDVLRSINDIVALTPLMVQALHEDLLGDDRLLRQRAYTLLAKYTLGHPALVRPDDTDGSKQLIVNFNLPRPGDQPEQGDSVIEAIPLDSDGEMRTCDTCGEEKAITEFVARSHRCVGCFEAGRDAVLARFAETPEE